MPAYSQIRPPSETPNQLEEYQIPSDRPQDRLCGELPALEGLILPHLSRLSPFRHGTACTWHRSRRKAATEPRRERHKKSVSY
jgi:hypothetical protein